MRRAAAVRVAAAATARGRLLLALALGLSACGSGGSYQRGALYSTSYRTIAVAVFKNDTFQPKVGPELCDALVKSVESQTPWKVTGEATADTVLRGTITRVELQPLSKSRATGLVEEMAYKVTVNYEWIDMKSGKAIVERNGFQESAVFVASRPNNEVEDLGRFQAVQNLANDIVASMQADW